MRDPHFFPFFSQEKGPENESRLYILWLLERVLMLFNITCVAPRSGRQSQQQTQRLLPPSFFYWIQIISLNFILLRKNVFYWSSSQNQDNTTLFWGEVLSFAVLFFSFEIEQQHRSSIYQKKPLREIVSMGRCSFLIIRVFSFSPKLLS